MVTGRGSSRERGSPALTLIAMMVAAGVGLLDQTVVPLATPHIPNLSQPRAGAVKLGLGYLLPFQLLLVVGVTRR